MKALASGRHTCSSLSATDASENGPQPLQSPGPVDRGGLIPILAAQRFADASPLDDLSLRVRLLETRKRVFHSADANCFVMFHSGSQLGCIRVTLHQLENRYTPNSFVASIQTLINSGLQPSISPISVDIMNPPFRPTT